MDSQNESMLALMAPAPVQTMLISSTSSLAPASATSTLALAPNAALLLANDWRDSQVNMDQELAPILSAAMILAKGWRESSSDKGDNILGSAHHAALHLAEDWSDSDYGDIDSNDSGDHSLPGKEQPATVTTLVLADRLSADSGSKDNSYMPDKEQIPKVE